MHFWQSIILTLIIIDILYLTLENFTILTTKNIAELIIFAIRIPQTWKFSGLNLKIGKFEVCQSENAQSKSSIWYFLWLWITFKTFLCLRMSFSRNGYYFPMVWNLLWVTLRYLLIPKINFDLTKFWKDFRWPKYSLQSWKL